MLIALAITEAVFTAILQAVALANANADIPKFLVLPAHDRLRFFSRARKKGRIALNDSPLLNQSHTRVISHAGLYHQTDVWAYSQRTISLTRRKSFLNLTDTRMARKPLTRFPSGSSRSEVGSVSLRLAGGSNPAMRLNRTNTLALRAKRRVLGFTYR